MRWIRIALAAVLAAATVQQTLAQAPAAGAPAYDFTGRTIRFLVGNAAGGVADTEMRLIARHIVEFLPGAPDIVVQNVTGAGGIRMLEFMAQLDPVTEPAMAMISSTLPFQARAGGIPSFDPRTTNWVGGYLRATSVCIVGTATGIESFEDLYDRAAAFGALAATATSAASFAIFSRGLGFRITPVYGYDSTQTLVLAVARGEIDGTCLPYTAYPVLVQPLVDAGQVRPILYNGPERRDDMTVPYAYDLPVVGGQEAFVAALIPAISFSRPLTIPAGADPAYVAAMRAAFDQMVVDPDFVAEAALLNVDLRYRSAAELEAMTATLYATPEPLVQEMKAFLFE